MTSVAHTVCTVLERPFTTINLKIFGFCSGVDFGYEGQKPLFKNVDFGIDMESRGEYVIKYVNAVLC